MQCSRSVFHVGDRRISDARHDLKEEIAAEVARAMPLSTDENEPGVFFHYLNDPKRDQFDHRTYWIIEQSNV